MQRRYERVLESKCLFSAYLKHWALSPEFIGHFEDESKIMMDLGFKLDSIERLESQLKFALIPTQRRISIKETVIEQNKFDVTIYNHEQLSNLYRT